MGRGQLGGEVVVVTMVSQSVAAQPVKESHEDAVDVMVEVDVPVVVMDSVTPVEQMDAVDVWQDVGSCEEYVGTLSHPILYPR